VTFEEALEEELQAIPELVGKVFPLDATGFKPPYVVYLSSEGLQDKTLEGYLQSKGINGELNILTHTYKGLKPLTSAVISKLVSFERRVVGANGPYIKSINYEEPVELYEQEVGWYRCNISFTIRV
jgi:hypothetical protein